MRVIRASEQASCLSMIQVIKGIRVISRAREGCWMRRAQRGVQGRTIDPPAKDLIYVIRVIVRVIGCIRASD